MNNLIIALICIAYLAFFVYFLKVMVDAETEKECKDCNVEMKHWDDKTVICPVCKKGKKLW